MAKKQIDFSEMSVGAQQARSVSQLKGKPMDFTSMTVGAQMEAANAQPKEEADVATEEPSKKKVDTGLSGQTGLLVSSFKPKNALFDSREELVAIAEREKNLTPEEKAKRAESVMAVNEYQVTTGGLGYGTGNVIATKKYVEKPTEADLEFQRQERIKRDVLDGIVRSNSYAMAAPTPIKNTAVGQALTSGLSQITSVAATALGALVEGVANFADDVIHPKTQLAAPTGFGLEGFRQTDFDIKKVKEEYAKRDKERPSSSESVAADIYNFGSTLNKVSQSYLRNAAREASIKEQNIDKGFTQLISEGEVSDAFSTLGVQAVSQLPQVLALAATGGSAEAVFAGSAALGTAAGLQEEYDKDGNIKAADTIKSIGKGIVEGVTETIFRTDIQAAKQLGKSFFTLSGDVAQQGIANLIKEKGKDAVQEEIVRNTGQVLKKAFGGSFEEGIEEVLAATGSFIVDRIEDGEWNQKNFDKLLSNAADAFFISAATGGFMSGASAIQSMRPLTTEQKKNIEKYNEIVNNPELSTDIRKAAKEKIDNIVKYSSDLAESEYNRLSSLPVLERQKAFDILAKINNVEEGKSSIKDLELQEESDKIIENHKLDLYNLFKENGLIKNTIETPDFSTPETKAEAEKAYQEELAKANENFITSRGIPTEPMKVSAGFSIKGNRTNIEANNEFAPSPNYPIEVVKSEKAKPINFSTKANPDASLQGEVYNVTQNGKKFATVLATQRNGVQEYYVPELEDSKPFANLDDAKFAVQEKLTGIAVEEKERSGIDRLRADKLVPKSDIIVKSDDGTEAPLDTDIKRSIKNAVEAFKSVSSAPVYLYKNTEDFKKGVAKELGEDSKELETAGKVGGGFFTNNKGEDSIHINLANVSQTTVAHELFHGTVVNVARQNPSAFAAMRDAIINKLGDSDLINAYDEKGKLVKLSAKEYLDRYSKQYSPEQQAEEFLSELTGLLATDMAKLKDATIWETIKLAIRNLVKTAGIDIPIFDKTADINETVKFFNDLSKSLKTGEKIDLSKLNIANEKQTTKQGAAVQTADRESQIAEEDAGLRDSVSKAVEKKQRRSGNPIKKKDRPPSKEGVRALAIEPVNPSDYVYQYFAKNGQVLRGNKDSNEKDALFSLFSKGRQGVKKEATKELQDRVNMIDNRENGALSISEIAEKLFAEYQQATKGDVGIDVNTPYDYMDFRNAVENAILGYKSGKAMAIAMLESKNQSTEEDAMALTEDEEFDKLRIQAEAAAMGMTYEEFKAKLAEFEGNPTIGAIEDAYAQALDMINDEDMAKLYELSDDDIAKIDELMADLDDSTGKLDDKLAEQKKIVRDLEAKRKKAVAAMGKAGKETQLDIAGKAPIQEQLFGADTKSLTDNLNAIDTQLAAAKADVAATQSAIDFQERGTVDMFKEETPAAKEEQDFSSDKILNSFLNKLSEYGSLIRNPLMRGEYIFNNDVSLKFGRFNKEDRNEIELNSISVQNKGAGVGSKTMKSITDAADSLGTKLTLGAKVFGDDPKRLGTRFLVNFYKKSGFNVSKEYLSDMDFASESDAIEYVIANPSESLEMEREPSKAKSEEKPQPIAEKQTKPITAKAQSKIDAETKSINDDIDFYTRKIENATEEIQNTINNYNEEKDRIIAEMVAVNSSTTLSKEEKSEKVGDLSYENTEARYNRESYIKNYKAEIAEANRELKKLNSRLAKLQEVKPATQEPSTTAGEATKPIVDESVPESNTERIEDFGEKIGGAKKDLVKKALDSYDMGIEVNYRNAKYAQLLPTINYNALIKEGTLTQDKAIVIDIVRSKVSTRGSKWYNDAWVDEMISTRQLISNILNDDVDVYDLIENLSIEDSAFDSTFNAMKAIGFPQSGLSLGNYFIKEFGPSNFAVVNGYRIVGGRHNTFDEAVEFLSDVLEGNKSKTKDTKFSVYQNRVTKEIYIGKKAGSDVIKIMDGFNNSDEAFAYINENRPALEQVWKEMRQNPDERRGENKVRVGEDYRKGRNVSGEEFGKTFGFRGVEFGNWVNNKERQESVNDAYDALMDLSTALGISPKSISLGGKLGLAFGARGSGKAMAHYERGRTVINLTKTKGAGSLAHEWWHALDNYFASPKSDKYMTEGTKDSGINARQEIKDAFSNIVNTINKETAIKTRSSKLDKARTDSYWSTDIEMTARSFESFVVSKLAETGNSNDYLANFKELTDWSNGGSVSAESYPYPSPEEKDVINKAYQELFNTVEERQEGAKSILFQKQGISVAPAYKYQMSEMFKDPQRLARDIQSKYDIRTTLRERGIKEAKLVQVEKDMTDNAVIGALSKVAVRAFKGIGALENTTAFKAGDEKVKAKDVLTGWAKVVGNSMRNVTLKSIQSNDRFAAATGRVAASIVGNLAKSNVLQKERALRTGSQNDANNEIAMLSKGLNGMIGFDEKALLRVHSLLDPEAFLENEDKVKSPSELSLNELRLYNTLRDMNDFIHEWHYENGFIDAPTYEKHKGKYFARMYEEIERKEFTDLHDAIDKMPAGADFRMFKARKDFSEVELTLMNDPIYITSRRLATMLHNKATIEFCNAMANDPSYKTFKKESDLPENNKKGFRKLESNGGGKRYGELTNKYVPLALYEELRGTTFATQFISKAYDFVRMYDGLAIRQFMKKTKTIYNPTTRLGNITSNFAFAWLAGVDPFTMIKNRTRAKDSLDAYDEWAKDLAIAGILGTDIVSADMMQKKKLKERKEDVVGQFVSGKYESLESQFLDFLNKKGASKAAIEKAKAKRDLFNTKRKELDKYMLESYGRTDDVAKISLYRSLVEDYGKTKEEAIQIVGESMQNYATVGKAYQFFSKVPVVGNAFVKFSSDLVRIVGNGFANRPLYMASFLGMMYATARLLSELSGEPEDEREAREARAFIPKIPLGFTDIPLTWKVGKYEVNAARFISPYYVYDAGYRSDAIAELTKFAPLQLSYDNKIGWVSDYTPTLGDPLTAPLIQVAMDRDYRGMPIADPFGSKYTNETVTESEAKWNRINYLGHSYGSPLWGFVANTISAAKGEGDLYGRRRDLGSAILNSVIKVQEMTSDDVRRSVENEIKYIDSEYKQTKTDITSRRNSDIKRIQEVMESDASESQKQEQIDEIKTDYTDFAEEKVDKIGKLVEKRDVPYQRWLRLQKLRK